MVEPSPLDDPHTAGFAWARYRRLVLLMAKVTALVVAVALAGFYFYFGWVSIHFFIALALGIGLTMMLGAALMGLVFLSSGTGHDAAVSNDLPPFDRD